MQVIKTCAALAALVTLGGCLALAPQTATRLDTTTSAAPALETPENYYRLLSPAPHNFRTGHARAGDPTRVGDTSERFELRHNDCGGADCINPRARAEIHVADTANPARVGRDTWYGYSFFNATVPAFDAENSLRLVFGQWTMGGENRPLFRFIQLGEGEGDFDTCDSDICAEPAQGRGDLVVHLADIAHERDWGDAENNGYICRLFDMTDRRGRWVDMTINTNFATGNDGYLRIWVDNRLVCDYRGPLVSRTSFRAGAHPEHRRGIFSSWTKRWDTATNFAPKPTLIVYYDEFRAGTSRTDVDLAYAAYRSSAAAD